MAHTMVTFRLHRRGVILLVIFGVILAALIYVAGYLTAVYTGKPAATVKEPAARSIPPPKPAPAKPATPPQPGEPQEALTLRVAVLTSEEEAKAEVARLTAFGLKPAIVQVPTNSGVMLFNIHIGQFTTRSAASAAARELQSRLGISSVIVPAQPPGNL
jgi:hypothetical protein